MICLSLLDYLEVTGLKRTNDEVFNDISTLAHISAYKNLNLKGDDLPLDLIKNYYKSQGVIS